MAIRRNQFGPKTSEKKTIDHVDKACDIAESYRYTSTSRRLPVKSGSFANGSSGRHPQRRPPLDYPSLEGVVKRVETRLERTRSLPPAPNGNEVERPYYTAFTFGDLPLPYERERLQIPNLSGLKRKLGFTGARDATKETNEKQVNSGATISLDARAEIATDHNNKEKNNAAITEELRQEDIVSAAIVYEISLSPAGVGGISEVFRIITHYTIIQKPQ
ncbi:hypothetical protein AAG570_004292 [Ranatra chinensis]|uniref:Uncharacterized protein n=1 Tax=Ranatra chinensis TaxID=642074 RepID=A0ABD0Y0F1_9HEMI